MISKDKTYRTRDGREMRIYATDAGGDCPIHGAVKNHDGWEICSWKTNGEVEDGAASSYDLIEVKPRIKRTVWLNLVKDAYGEIVVSTYRSKEEADRHHYDRRIACVKVEIDCEEGEEQ